METGLVKINKELPLQILAPMGCGIQTGAGGKSLEPPASEL